MGTTQPQNFVPATEVTAAGPLAGHVGLSALPAPAAVEAPTGFPLLADLGDPYGDPPTFDEVVNNEYPVVSISRLSLLSKIQGLRMQVRASSVCSCMCTLAGFDRFLYMQVWASGVCSCICT